MALGKSNMALEMVNFNEDIDGDITGILNCRML